MCFKNMQRDLGTFSICPTLKSKLFSAGFTVVEDLKDFKYNELCKALNISNELAKDLLQTVFPSLKNKIRYMTALDLLLEESSQQHIITFSQHIDAILGGGISFGNITEICGVPGAGKTQLCFQLCVDVQLPEVFGGVEGEAIFIDTEGSFVIERVLEIAKGTVQHCHVIANTRQDTEQIEILKTFTADSILSRIQYFRCQSYTELLAIIQLLPEFLKEHSKIRLIVIDSIAFHFRHDFTDFSLRTRLLHNLAQSFTSMVSKYSLAIVLTNHMTTKSGSGTPSLIIPSLGESWNHICNIRLILSFKNTKHYSTLDKSSLNSQITIPFIITGSGIRDLPEIT